MEEMKKKLDEDCEKLKGEIVSLKKEFDLLNKNLKSSQTLDDILSHQRSPLDKLGLGYVGEPKARMIMVRRKRMWGSQEEMILPVPVKARVKMTL